MDGRWNCYIKITIMIFIQQYDRIEIRLFRNLDEIDGKRVKIVPFIIRIEIVDGF